MGYKSVRAHDARYHGCSSQFEEETRDKIRKDESHGEKIRLGNSSKWLMVFEMFSVNIPK